MSYYLAPYDIDLQSGQLIVQWPSLDARMDIDILELYKRKVTLAFIDGYRAANPGITDDELKLAVLKWASK